MISPRQNPYTDDTLAQLLLHCPVADGIQWYALLDHAFLPRLSAKLDRMGRGWVSTYASVSGSETEISPILLPLPADQAELAVCLRRLLALCDGLPMLSFWASHLPLPVVVSHFENYFDVILLPDKTAMVLRYADVRTLAYLLRHMDANQKQEFLAPFEFVLSFDAAAKVVTLLGSALGRIGEGKLQLAEPQWTAMLDDALADWLFDDFAAAYPADTPPGQIYSQLQKKLEEARASGLQSEEEITDYCLSA